MTGLRAVHPSISKIPTRAPRNPSLLRRKDTRQLELESLLDMLIHSCASRLINLAGNVNLFVKKNIDQRRHCGCFGEELRPCPGGHRAAPPCPWSPGWHEATGNHQVKLKQLNLFSRSWSDSGQGRAESSHLIFFVVLCTSKLLSKSCLPEGVQPWFSQELTS